MTATLDREATLRTSREQMLAPSRRSVVCQVLHSLNVGGAEVLAARLARQLREDCEFHFVCLDELGSLGEELRADGFPVTVLGRRSGFDWRCAWRLARSLRGARVDLVHAHQYTPFFYAATARQLYRRAPVLFTEHGRHFPDYPRRKRMLANRLLLSRRDRVVGVGRAVRQALIENEGIPDDRVDVIHNGIDTSRYSQAPPARDAVRHELGLENDDFVMLMVARLDYLKDHATAIRSLQRVVQSRPNARLVIAGDGPERTRIERQIEQAGLAAHIRLLGTRNDVERLLRAVDVFLLTSISEGIPLTAIEAMAAEVPVVATHVGGVGEVVDDRVTGLLAAAGNDAELASCLLRLSEMAHERRTMGIAGRERAVSLFSESRMHACYLALYREMLSE